MQIAAAEKEKSVENVFNTERAKLGSLETNGAGDLRGARRPLGAQVCHLVRKSSGHSCRDSVFLTHMARILGRVWRQAHEHERAERECISEEERKGEDGKCEEDSPSDGAHFLFPPKRRRGDEANAL